uniref:Uncharacterized protein n=1 Tax=Pseudomonas phage HRDY3 TaxID=3236930 RepID=A0AB39CEQ3_9VIRU
MSTDPNSRFARTEFEQHDLHNFEVVNFREAEKSGDEGRVWFNHILLESMTPATVQRLASLEGFNGSQLHVCCYINEHQVVHTDLAKLVSYFAHNLFEQKLRRAHFDDFEKAVKTTAQGLVDRRNEEVTDMLHQLGDQLRNLTDQTTGVVQREWDRPYRHQVTPEMVKAGVNALSRFFDLEPDVDFAGNVTEEKPEAFGKNAVEAIWRAMDVARSDQPVYKIKLPAAHNPDIAKNLNVSRRIFMDEIKESLRQQGLVFEEEKQ